MPVITLAIQVTLPWCNTLVHKKVPAGTTVSAVLEDLAPLTRDTECLAVSEGKALLPHSVLTEDMHLTVLPLLCGG